MLIIVYCMNVSFRKVISLVFTTDIRNFDTVFLDSEIFSCVEIFSIVLFGSDGTLMR